MSVKTWDFTINNPKSSDTSWCETLAKEAAACAATLEVGAEGTTHIQGRVTFKRTYRLKALKKLHGRAHWEQTKCKQDQMYVLKEDSDIIVHKPPKGKGFRSDLEEIMKMVKDGAKEVEIANFAPDTWARNYRAIERYRMLVEPKRNWVPEVKVYWGPTGTGKTRRALEEHPDAYFLRSKWWDGYDGEEHVIIDEFEGWLPFSFLLAVLDRYPMRVENKGGGRNLPVKTITFTSHFHPEDWYPEPERWPELKRRITAINNFDGGGIRDSQGVSKAELARNPHWYSSGFFP